MKGHIDMSAMHSEEGLYTIYNEDCLSMMMNVHDNSVDLLITDPPYNLGNFMKSRSYNIKNMRDNFFVDAEWDNLDEDSWGILMDNFFKESARVMKKGGSLIIFMSLMKTETIISLAKKHSFYYKTTGVWHKTNPMPRNMNLHFVGSVEGWLYFIYDKKTGTFNNHGKAIHDFIETPVISQSEKTYGKHPTQKPLKLIDHFVTILSHEGDLVLDPFMGSGTSGVSAMVNKRRFIGSEIHEEYFQLSYNRIQQSLNVS